MNTREENTIRELVNRNHDYAKALKENVVLKCKVKYRNNGIIILLGIIVVLTIHKSFIKAENSQIKNRYQEVLKSNTEYMKINQMWETLFDTKYYVEGSEVD